MQDNYPSKPGNKPEDFLTSCQQPSYDKGPQLRKSIFIHKFVKFMEHLQAPSHYC